MEHTIQEEKVGGYTIKVYSDPSPMNPREDDNATVMVFRHPKYNLGDKHNYKYAESINDLIDAIKMDHDVLALRVVYIYDHSGISISTNRTYPYDDRWDAGALGVAFISRESVAAVHGEGREYTGQELFNIIDGEVAEYNAYISGDMCGYAVEDKFGEEVDSCWGYYSAEEAAEAGRDIVAHLMKDDAAGHPITEKVAEETLMKVLPKIDASVTEMMQRITHMEETHGDNKIDYTFEYNVAEKKLDAIIEVVAIAKDRVHGRNPGDKDSAASKIRKALGYNQ